MTIVHKSGGIRNVGQTVVFEKTCLKEGALPVVHSSTGVIVISIGSLDVWLDSTLGWISDW